MIEIGKKYCPVTLYNNGLGDEPHYTLPTTPWRGGYVQPCRYPWQTPYAVLGRDVTMARNADVLLSGTFELYWTNQDESEIEPDIYGCGADIDMIGKRVYYDAVHEIYVVQNATNIPEMSTAATFIGNFPGAATVGYISGVRMPDPADSGFVTITIDPRPARSQYRVASFTGAVSNFRPGTPVTILPDNTALPYSQSVHQSCDGVVAGLVAKSDASIPDQVIICTAGPAWIFPRQEQLYAVCNHDDITEEGCTPQHVPIDANLAFVPFEGSDVPRIGFAHLGEWYQYDSSSTVYRMIIDVDPEYPTIGDYENANHAYDGVIVAP